MEYRSLDSFRLLFTHFVDPGGKLYSNVADVRTLYANYIPTRAKFHALGDEQRSKVFFRRVLSVHKTIRNAGTRARFWLLLRYLFKKNMKQGILLKRWFSVVECKGQDNACFPLHCILLLLSTAAAEQFFVDENTCDWGIVIFPSVTAGSIYYTILFVWNW